jgi:transposase
MSPSRKGQKVDELLDMSTKELSRLEVMQRLAEKRLSQKDAAKMLDLSVRQVKRLRRSYRRTGAAGLVSKRRGRASPNQLDGKLKHKVLSLLHGKYKGFGPTLACEKLVGVEKLSISDESVRQIMITEDLWKPRKSAKLVVHQMRERRACFGELVQMDGSPHAWFEDRGPACTLLVLIDDATGRLLGLLFVDQESFHNYVRLVRTYLERFGKPLAFYTDKHGVFRVNQASREKGDAQTQFGRAMQELGIEILCANSPQAKGRIERANQTLQDRLVKEMRLIHISNPEQGNVYLPKFLEDFNSRFAVPPRSSNNAHRPLTIHENLNHILAWQETRLLSKNLTLQFNKVVYQIQTKPGSYALRNARVTVCENAQAAISILYQSQELPFTIFHKQERLAEIVDSKNVDRALPAKTSIPAPDHPWRHRHLFPTPKPVSSS